MLTVKKDGIWMVVVDLIDTYTNEWNILKKLSLFYVNFTAIHAYKNLILSSKKWWTFELNSILAARAFKIWRSLTNQVILLVKRISKPFHFSVLYID